ncbi:uncharacterized protein CDAR_410601 [Caerostris darwini]|uniref:Endonuclease/exonuclease/phosphatase domain-containing protein n=1 Tax=Caerostris darwini TaxID=1538125 RepID=A0AAV4NC88_9ARAC|nr:uncharacterized protein CDAR_410601 [Caerostris darwini]
MEPNLDILKSHLLRFENFPFIILGDFNVKSRVWGQRDFDHRGSTLLSFCHLLHLTIENYPDSPPSYSSSRRDSWVDLLLTKNLSYNIALEVRDEIINSDHNLFFIEYSLLNTEFHSTSKINIKTIDWLSIKPKIHKIIVSNLDTNNLSIKELNSRLEDIQNQIFNSTAKKHSNIQPSNRSKRRSAIWWTREFQYARSRTRALRRLFQKERDPVLRNMKKVTFSKSQANYKKLILSTKRKKFKEFINSITSTNLFGNSFNIISKKKKRTNINPSTGNNFCIVDSATAILDHHFPWSNTPIAVLSSERQDDFLPISSSEKEACICEIIKEIYHTNRAWFLDLFNLLVSRGVFPETWKKARIVLLEKE